MTFLQAAKSALHALAKQGDIYTDAHECAARVLAAENLKSLVSNLRFDGDEIAAKGSLLLDGEPIEDVCVSIDGYIFSQSPEVGTKEGKYTIAIAGIADPFRVASFHVGDQELSPSFVVDEYFRFFHQAIIPLVVTPTSTDEVTGLANAYSQEMNLPALHAWAQDARQEMTALAAQAQAYRWAYTQAQKRMSKADRSTWTQAWDKEIAYRTSKHPVILDLDKEMWESIKEAANKSNWIPRDHYFVNDWASDVRSFLTHGAKDFLNNEAAASQVNAALIAAANQTPGWQDLVRAAQTVVASGRSTMEAAIEKLIEAFEDEHPQHTIEDHQFERSEGNTNLSDYWEWVAHQIESDGQSIDENIAAHATQIPTERP